MEWLIDQIKQLLPWLIENKEWFLNGIGVTIISVIGYLFMRKSNVVNNGVFVKRDAFISEGISYRDAVAIAEDVYKNNILKFSEEASKIAHNRVDDLIKKFFNEVYKKNPNLIVSMKDPGMQYAFFIAQREYARIGDSTLEELLVDILVERATHKSHVLNKIVLDESLEVVSKLTVEHLDAITINCLLIRAAIEINSKSDFLQFIEQSVLPFCKNLSCDNSYYEHLEYCKCGSIMRVARWPSIDGLFGVRWPNIMSNTTHETDLREIIHELLNTHPLIIKLIKAWNNSQLSKFDLTNVGTYVAKVNYKRVTKMPLYTKTNLILPYVDSRYNGPQIPDM